MRTIFHHQKPFQKEFNSIQSSLRILQNKPKEILSGSKEPSNLVGQNGNLYVRTEADGTKTTYIKENGKWL